MSHQLISQMHPWLYALAVEGHRLRRNLNDMGNSFCAAKSSEVLPHKVYTHESLLRRKLGASDPRLQESKIVNLRLAAQSIDGVLIKPGETFSLWKLIGRPDADRGFQDGMLLKDGEVKTGTGGGLCQVANLLYWIFLHSPLTVTERHRHGFDPFPDEGRVLPFGSGATIFYNYLDLRVKNNTDKTFQIRVWLDDTHLRGELRSDVELEYGYHVFQTGHAFLRDANDGKIYRTNTLWRDLYDRKTGAELATEKICYNFCRIKYQPSDDIVIRPLCRTLVGASI